MSHLPAVSLALVAVFFACLWYREKKRTQAEKAHGTQELSLQKQNLRKEQDALLNALTDSFLLVNPDGLILFANEPTTELVSGRRVEGRNVREVFLDERVTDTIAKSLATGRSIVQRIVLPNQASLNSNTEQKGETAWLIDAAPLDRNAKKMVTRVVIQDITTQHQAEQVRKDFVANASHELRTPLSIINGYLENLIEGDFDDAELSRRSLNVMKKHGDRIARIVEDMLLISRLESGEAALLNIAPFPFSDCIQDILERLEPVISDQNATIKLKIEDPSLILRGDRFYWAQIFFNLIENALKQNPNQSLKVEIGAKRHSNGIRLWVADNGAGIPSSDIPFIFRRFYRVEKHHNQDSIKGTGLGLSIVRRGVEAHDGTIEVSSVPGRKTTFTIELPASAEVKQLSLPI